MFLRLSKKETLIIFLVLIICILSVVTMYFLLLSPLSRSLEAKQNELKTEQQMLSILQGKLTQTQQGVYDSTIQLQQRVPVKPLLEQFLLDLEKAEVISGSFISSMNFEQLEIEPSPTNSVEQLEQAQKEQKEKLQNSLPQTKKESNTEDNIVEEPLPEGVKKITVTLSVESATYFEMETFIETLESLKRIVVIENLDFVGKEEITTIDSEIHPIVYNITVSAFYMPTLTDLQNQLPKMDSPKPSNKTNPFVGFASISPKKDTYVDNIEGQAEKPEEEQTEVVVDYDQKTEQSNSVKVITYTVKPNDTLYSIAMNYYKSRKGERIIMNWNGMSNETVYVGQVLQIPIEK